MEWKKAQEKTKKAREELEAARGEAVRAEKDLVAVNRLLGCVQFGPLSRESTGKLDEGDLVEIVQAYKDHPEVADVALDVALQSEHPKTVIKGVKTVGTLAGQKFGGYPEQTTDTMSRNALVMGGALGGDYFERMGKYYSEKQDNKDYPFKGSSSVEKGKKCTASIGSKVVGTDGTVNFDNAREEVNHLHFHPSSLQNPLPTLARQIEDTRRRFEDKNDPKYRDKLKTVTAPTSKNAQGLVRQTLGLDGKTTPTDQQTRASVLSAMMTPLQQGEVGSCFVTSPCRKQCETNPYAVMGDLSTIATTGSLTKGKPPTKVPAVTNIDPKENALLRSWEYSIATVASCQKNSREKKQVKQGLFGAYDTKTRGSSLDSLVKGDTKGETKTKIEEEVHKVFTFEYDLTGDLGGVSSDQSSTKGAFVLMTSGGKAIRSEKDFVEELKGVLVNKVRLDGKAVNGLLDDPKFIESMKVNFDGKGPWAPESGGLSEDAIALFTGKTAERKKLLPDTTEGEKSQDKGTGGKGTTTPVNKAQALLGGVVSQLTGKGNDKFTPVSVEGIHGMNLLPDHPSLGTLKGKDAKEVGEKLEQHLVKPGKKLAETKLEPKRLAYLQDKAVRSFLGEYKDKLAAPKVGSTPGGFKASLLKQLEGNVDEKALKTLSDQIDTLLLKELEAPEFMLTDTNWGFLTDHKYMVVAPDPTTGEPAIWKKSEPSGADERVDEKWLKAEWKVYNLGK